MRYFRKNRLWICIVLFFAGSYNLYFGLLHKTTDLQELLYIDMLLGVCLAIAAGLDSRWFYKREKQKEALLETDRVICRELDWKETEGLDIASHDVYILEEQLREQFDLNCDLQDYITAWCHEVKLPLSACLLMNEKIGDTPLRVSQKEQLEKIRQQLNSALLGCKVQSRLFDLQVRAVDLAECVRTSVHNNQFFLIQKQFDISLQVQPVIIYTDPSWFVYVLDQLIQNSIKYAKEHPMLKIWSRAEEDMVELAIEDNGEGITDSDIRRVFERGFTGNSHHNGKYKSTGMGLYMVSLILGRLGHGIKVESRYGFYTKFTITVNS